MAPPCSSWMWSGLNVSETPWPGSSELFEMAERLAANDRLPHAWLIVGMLGIPAGPYADALAYLFLCERPREDGPCLACPSCRQSHEGNHPDFTVVQPDGLGIRIDAVRAALARIQYRSESGGRQVVRLVAADRLGPEAAAALLKGIEEPHEGTVFVLSADMPGRVPATIRSRCMVVPLRPVRREVLVAWLTERGFEDAQAEALAHQVDGAPGRLMELLRNRPEPSSDADSGAERGRAEPSEGDTGLDEEGQEAGRPEETLDAVRRQLRSALRSGSVSGVQAHAILDELGLVQQALQRGVPVRTVLDTLAMIRVPGAPR